MLARLVEQYPVSALFFSPARIVQETPARGRGDGRHPIAAETRSESVPPHRL